MNRRVETGSRTRCPALSRRIRHGTFRWRQINLMVACLWLGCGQATAQDIVNEQGVFDRTISFFDPVGQSFIASSSVITSIQMAFSITNPGHANQPLSTVLFRGEGFDGEVISTGQLQLPANLPDANAPVGPFMDLQLGTVAVVPGEQYTFAVLIPSNSARNAAVYGDTNSYPDGRMLHGPDANAAPNANDDLRFRIGGDQLFNDGFETP